MAHLRTRLVIGCGYLGARAAHRYRAAGDRVFVTTRSRERADLFGAQGFLPIVCDVTRPDTLANLPQVDSILMAVGYDRHSTNSRRELYHQGLRNVLQHVPLPRDRWIQISSTSVFGDHQGEFVDESTPCAPQQDGGEACWLAEQELNQHPMGARAVILRLAGIYGPGRVPNLSQLQTTTRPLTLDGYLNLIHVDDGVEVVVACDQAPLPSLYVVSDGHPVLRRDFYAEVARCARVSWPPAPQPADEDSQRTARSSRGGESKRVSPGRLFRELQPAMHYRDFRQGLASIFDDSQSAESSTNLAGDQ